MEILKKDAKTGEVIEKICFVDGDKVRYEIVGQKEKLKVVLRTLVDRILYGTHLDDAKKIMNSIEEL